MTAVPNSMNPDAPVLVIGASGIDLVGRLETDLQIGTSNPAQIRFSFGGVARNVAENLARLGQPVTLLTVVGEDSDGDALIAHTSAAGVNTEWILRTADRHTGTYLAVVDQAGELQFALDDMNAVTLLDSEYIRGNQDLFKSASALFVDANLQAPTIKTAFHLARRAKLPIFADPTSKSLANRLTPYLDRLQVITPNSTEATIFCGETVDPADSEAAMRAAKYLVSQGVDLPIITLAEFGVCYATSETSGYIPAIRTETSGSDRRWGCDDSRRNLRLVE